MENKINIAQLLKDCPEGMELDCILFNNSVRYDGLDNDDIYPIIILTENDDYLYLTEEGYLYNIPNSKCVIFPKGKTTWEGFVPPCRFKDGDIVSTMNGIWIGIVKRPVSGACETYVTIYGDSLVYNENIYCFERLATEEEKQKLFQAIKDNGYKWNEETKTLEKLPKFKVGDKVIAPSHKIHTIESIRWNGNEIYYNTVGEGFNTSYTAEDLQPYKEETMEVSEEFYNKYCVNCGSQRCTAEGEWLEECKHYKEETMNRKYNVEEYLKVWEETENGLEVVVNDNFELKEDNGKFYIIKKQPEYPKTCEECLKILGKTMNSLDNMRGYKYALFMRLQQLLISREAYWKIAGDWKPDFTNKEQKKFTISIIQDEIEFSGTYVRNSLLAFPTVEMRDAFYENFKDLIEQCKELL